MSGDLPTSVNVIDHMPAMCRFIRRRMTEEGRLARDAGPAGAQLAEVVKADIRSRRELITYAESWLEMRGRDGGTWGYPGDDGKRREIRATLEQDLALIGYMVKRMAARYAGHPSYRPEWQVPR